jgi:hypothetical protein
MAHEWDEIPEGWSNAEADMFFDVAGDLNPDDGMLQAVYHAAFFDTETGFSPSEREAIRDFIADYVFQEYGVDFYEDLWDWEAWRELYE